MPDTELALLVDRFMRRIHFGLQSKAESFDTEKVGPGGGIILLTISEMGCPELNALTERVARDKSQMTRMVRSLETKGLIKRDVSPRDARVSVVQLTPLGQQVVQTLNGAVAETIDEILAPISGPEKQQLRDLLGRAMSPAAN